MADSRYEDYREEYRDDYPDDYPLWVESRESRTYDAPSEAEAGQKRTSGVQIVSIVTMVAVVLACIIVGGLLLMNTLRFNSDKSDAEVAASRSAYAQARQQKEASEVVTVTETVAPTTTSSEKQHDGDRERDRDRDRDRDHDRHRDGDRDRGTDRDGEPTAPREPQAQPKPDDQPFGNGPVFVPPPNGRLVAQHNGYNVWAGNKNTSDDFAVALAKEVDLHGPIGQGFDVRVYSETTHKNYIMRCESMQLDGITCTGGDNAQVFLER